MNLRIRKSRLSDAAEIAAILTQGQEYKLERGDTAWGEEPYSVEETERLIATGDDYVVSVGDDIVGTFLLQWQDDIVWDNRDDQGGYIHQLAIKDGFHGQGLGAGIINWAAGTAAGKGRKFIRMDCAENNQKLCRYYESLGFKQVGLKSIPEHNNYTAALFERPAQ